MNATLSLDKTIAPATGTVSVRRWIAVLGAMLGAFMAVLDIQITNASLPDILGSLGATLDEGSWISTSYLVAEIIVIPLTAWLATVFSPRRKNSNSSTARLPRKSNSPAWVFPRPIRSSPATSPSPCCPSHRTHPQQSAVLP